MISSYKETYAQEIENHESAIKRAESEKADYSAKVKDVQQQIDAYILTDPVATKRAGLEKERKALNLLFIEVAVFPLSIMLSIHMRMTSESTDSQESWLSKLLKYASKAFRSSP